MSTLYLLITSTSCLTNSLSTHRKSLSASKSTSASSFTKNSPLYYFYFWFRLEGLLISKSDFPRCVTTDTSTITNSFRSRCVLPEHPNFGRWSTENGSLLPGMSVPAGTTLDVECDDGYVVDGNNRTSCQDQKWTPTVGTCSSNFR
jgi:hypothetical protein